MSIDPRLTAIKDFEYNLPDDRIAAYPMPQRDASKLLQYKDKKLTEYIFSDIPELVPADSLIIFNNTRVVNARLLFNKPSGQAIEIFCLEPDPALGDLTKAMSTQGSVDWRCLVGKASKWTAGLKLVKKLTSGDLQATLEAEMTGKENDFFTIRLSWTPASLSFAEVLHAAGAIPLPPYIRRIPEASDEERYQTVYAQTGGSVAAPTAGLHFTPTILQQLQAKHILQDFVTLHVGAGTFKPVKAELMNDHAMHAEFIEMSRSAIENIYRFADGNITVVGTTSLRAIESLYWMGVKILTQKMHPADGLSIEQWYPYLGHPEITPKEALQAVLVWLDQSGTDTLIAKTSLLIAPGYKIKIPTALVTNFHQPRSTLLLLVAAFMGEDWKSVYAYALQHDFRFLSYGDACLLFRP